MAALKEMVRPVMQEGLLPSRAATWLVKRDVELEGIERLPFEELYRPERFDVKVTMRVREVSGGDTLDLYLNEEVAYLDRSGVHFSKSPTGQWKIDRIDGHFSVDDDNSMSGCKKIAVVDEGRVTVL